MGCSAATQNSEPAAKPEMEKASIEDHLKIKHRILWRIGQSKNHALKKMTLRYVKRATRLAKSGTPMAMYKFRSDFRDTMRDRPGIAEWTPALLKVFDIIQKEAKEIKEHAQ